MSIRTQYDSDLEALKAALAEMGRSSADAVEDALEALCTADADAAAGIVKGDGRINNMERDIEHRCMTLLLRQQPVAGDLRRISTAMKVVTDMERIGDHAADIAEIIPHLVTVRKEGDPAVSQAIRMGQKAHQMILTPLPPSRQRTRRPPVKSSPLTMRWITISTPSSTRWPGRSLPTPARWMPRWTCSWSSSIWSGSAIMLSTWPSGWSLSAPAATTTRLCFKVQDVFLPDEFFMFSSLSGKSCRGGTLRRLFVFRNGAPLSGELSALQCRLRGFLHCKELVKITKTQFSSRAIRIPYTTASGRKLA